MRPADLVRKVILTEMVTLYRAPSQVQNAEQGAVYQGAIIETLAQFNTTEDELTSMWAKFKRHWTKTTWPTPGELCKALSTEQARTRQPRYASLPEPEPDEPLTPADRAEIERAMADIPDGPLKASLTKAGQALLDRQ